MGNNVAVLKLAGAHGWVTSHSWSYLSLVEELGGVAHHPHLKLGLDDLFQDFLLVLALDTLYEAYLLAEHASINLRCAPILQLLLGLFEYVILDVLENGLRNI